MRIALIHAVRVAMDPVRDAFDRLWPEADLMNLLDDSFSADLARSGAITQEIFDRIGALADYGVAAGAEGVLYTCSAFGPPIEAVQARLDCPVLKPNEAMFRDAVRDAERIGLLASFEPSIAPMRVEFEAITRGTRITLETTCEPGAMVALNAGDGARHDALLADAAMQLRDCDAIMLAQFSTARARDAVEAATGKPVLTSPDSAVLEMRRRLTT